MTRDGASITQDKSAEITEGLELPAKMPRLDRARKTRDFRRTLGRGWDGNRTIADHSCAAG